MFGWVSWEKERAGEIMGHDWFRLRQLSKIKVLLGCFRVFDSEEKRREGGCEGAEVFRFLGIERGS